MTLSSGNPRIARSDRLSKVSHSALAKAIRSCGSITITAIGRLAKSAAKLGPAFSARTASRPTAAPGRAESGKHCLHRLRVLDLVPAVTDLGRAVQPLGVPADML